MRRVWRRIAAGLLAAGMLLALAGCGGGSDLQDGYYSAKMGEYNNGWKEYIAIVVKGGSIVSVEYNAENASGFIKSWDNAYMQLMLHSNGTYPNEYTRYYASQLVNSTGSVDIDAITGATSSYNNFLRLSEAAIQRARAGDSSLAIVSG